MYKSILLPVELGNPGSWQVALPVALELTRLFNAKLHLVNIVPDIRMSAVSTYLPADFESSAIKQAGEKLHEFALEHIPEDIRGQSHVAHGVVRQEIVKAADTLDCDLIIMAPHRPEMADYFISPSTGFVVGHTKRTVLVVRE